MKIGIIIYSQTGNTLSVAESIKSKLLKYNVTIERIGLVDSTIPRKEPFKLKTIPDVNSYDVIIFGSLVEAFSLSPVMKEYIKQIKSLKGKKVFGFVTEYFPYAWMGGNNAIKQMKELCKKLDTNILETYVINWKNKKRLDIIEDVSNSIASQIISIKK